MHSEERRDKGKFPIAVRFGLAATAVFEHKSAQMGSQTGFGHEQEGFSVQRDFSLNDKNGAALVDAPLTLIVLVLTDLHRGAA